MDTLLSPRNSEVNALEQRGYLIGKKIGQVIFISQLRFRQKNVGTTWFSQKNRVLITISEEFELN